MFALMLVTILVLAGIQDKASGSVIPLLDPYAAEPTMEDNSLDPNAGVGFQPENRDWVKITNAPPPVVRRPSGTIIELECEASGSPAPTIRWLQDNVPASGGDEFESNIVPLTNNREMAKVRSRLVINNVLPRDKIAYTCVCQAGTKSTYHTTTVYTTGNYMKTQNITELLLLNEEILKAPLKPRIILFYSIIMADMGSTLVIPCRVIGNPHPEIVWFDDEEQLITKQDTRRKVLPSGELVIQGLRWSDMGGFTCVARNVLSKDSVTTFVYPFKLEK